MLHVHVRVLAYESARAHAVLMPPLVPAPILAPVSVPVLIHTLLSLFQHPGHPVKLSRMLGGETPCLCIVG